MSGVKASVEIVVTLTIDVLDFSCSIRARFLVADGFVKASTHTVYNLLCEICSRNLVVRNTSTYTDKVLLDWSRLDTGFCRRNIKIRSQHQKWDHTNCKPTLSQLLSE